MTADTPWAEPLGLSRDAHWDDAWTDRYSNEYVLPHPDDPSQELRAGRASELGKTISNTFTLNRWHKEMVLRGMVIRRSILQRAAIALHDGLAPNLIKRTLWDLCKEAEDVAGAKEKAAIGTGFHKLTELYDAGKISLDSVPEPWDRDMVAYAALLQRVGVSAIPEFTERIIWNRPINTAGRLDRLWLYPRHCSKLHVGDLKTGRELKYGWHEIPLQLEAYATATHLFNTEDGTWSEMPDVCADVGLVVHVPSDGMKDEDGGPTGSRVAELFEVSLDTAVPVSVSLVTARGPLMSPAQIAIAVQRWQKVKHLSKLIYRVEVTEHGGVADVPLTLAEQIDLCDTRPDLDALWADAKARKEWKGHHTRRARERLEVLAG